MRSLFKLIDADDIRWIVTAWLVVSSWYSWAEANQARAFSEARINALEAVTFGEDSAPTATEWGNGSLCVDLREQEPAISACRRNHARPLWADGGR